MIPPPQVSESGGGMDPGPFVTTHWSVVLRAARNEEPGSTESLEVLCRSYWQPLYWYLRRTGRSPADAEDLTQGFFAHLLSGDRLRLADPERGRFRGFLLSSLKNYLVSEWRHQHRDKRGGGQRMASLDCEAEERMYLREPSSDLAPDRLYEQRWAGRMLEEAMERTREGFGRPDLFAALQGCLQGDAGAVPYAEIGRRFQLSETAVKVTVHRLRGRFKKELFRLVRATLSDPSDEAAVRHEVSELSVLFSCRGVEPGV